jgi:predicted dehydrogenase
MESGALALLSINWFTQSHTAKNGLWYEFNHVTGTQGEAYYMSGKGTWLKTRGANSKIFEYGLDTGGEFVRIKDENANSGHMNCISQWLRMLRGEESKVLTYGTDVIKTVEVAEAAYLSEKTGKVINLPITPAPWGEEGV